MPDQPAVDELKGLVQPAYPGWTAFFLDSWREKRMWFFCGYAKHSLRLWWQQLFHH